LWAEISRTENTMKKILVSFLIAMFAVASVAFSAEIDNLPWNQSNIKTLRALPKDAVFQFFIRQYDPDNEMEWTEENIEWDSEWYPAGEGKYQLAVNHQSGPDIGYVTIYWQDAPGKFRSQSFDGAGSAGMQWYEGGPQFADLSGGGTTELIQLDRVGRVSRRRTKFIPDGEWPQVYRLRDGKYVEASRDFPGFYEKQILPMLDRAITQTRKDVATPKPSPVPGIYDGSQNDQQSERYLAALIMARDKVLRVIGRDPTAGLAQARQWTASSDPVLVDDAKAVLEDIGGHQEDVRAATLALERASQHYGNQSW